MRCYPKVVFIFLFAISRCLGEGVIERHIFGSVNSEVNKRADSWVNINKDVGGVPNRVSIDSIQELMYRGYLFNSPITDYSNIQNWSGANYNYELFNLLIQKTSRNNKTLTFDNIKGLIDDAAGTFREKCRKVDNRKLEIAKNDVYLWSVNTGVVQTFSHLIEHPDKFIGDFQAKTQERLKNKDFMREDNLDKIKRDIAEDMKTIAIETLYPFNFMQFSNKFAIKHHTFELDQSFDKFKKTNEELDDLSNIFSKLSANNDVYFIQLFSKQYLLSKRLGILNVFFEYCSSIKFSSSIDMILAYSERLQNIIALCAGKKNLEELVDDSIDAVFRFILREDGVNDDSLSFWNIYNEQLYNLIKYSFHIYVIYKIMKKSNQVRCFSCFVDYLNGGIVKISNSDLFDGRCEYYEYMRNIVVNDLRFAPQKKYTNSDKKCIDAYALDNIDKFVEFIYSLID